jgi:hypothetical protein
VKNGPWPFARGLVGDPGKSKLVVDGRTSARGLGMHPPGAGSFAAVHDRLDGKATLLQAGVAIAETTGVSALRAMPCRGPPSI